MPAQIVDDLVGITAAAAAGSRRVRVSAAEGAMPVAPPLWPWPHGSGAGLIVEWTIIAW
jgi:hypothetical protein